MKGAFEDAIRNLIHDILLEELDLLLKHVSPGRAPKDQKDSGPRKARKPKKTRKPKKQRSAEEMRCRFSSNKKRCQKRSKGPRFKFMCEEHCDTK